MKLIHLLAFAPLALLAQTPRQAANAPQSPQSPQASPTPTAVQMWRCELPGGTYEVALRAINSVSSHEYVIDGGVRVTEVNIATNASLIARFYYLEPNTGVAPAGIGAATIDKAQAFLAEGLSKTGSDAWKKVVKSYPTSTHAHTVEYRLESKESLKALYDSAELSFRLQKPGAFQGQ